MARLRKFAVSTSVVSIALSVIILSTVCFAAAAPDRITSPIVAAQTVRLAGGVPLKAQPQFDRGPADPSLKLSYVTLLTVPSPAQKKALNKLLADQQNPHSALYHKWLTPEQYADRFGLSRNDIMKLTAWLQSQGFTIVRTARGRNWVVFSGTAAQVEKTFQTDIHTFVVDGETHFANTTPPSIPAALKGIVTGFHGMNDFRPKSQAVRGRPEYTFPYNSNYYLFIAPGDIGSIYDVASLWQYVDGTGQKLAVMGQTGIYESDLTNFRQNFGLSAISCTTSGDIITGCNTSNFQYVLVNGSATSVYNDLPEADIDIEWSGSIARNAQVIYVNSTDPSGGGVWDSWYYTVDNDLAPVITMSYTTPCELAEAYNNGLGGEFTYASDESELAKANSEGITFMNSSGDTGAAECDYGSNISQYGYAAAYPASSQYVTGVGGTSIPAINPNEYNSTYWDLSNGWNGGSALGYIPEQPWNDAQEFGLICSHASPPSYCANGFGTGIKITGWATAQEVLGISAGGGGVSNCVSVDVNGVCQGGWTQPTWQSGISASAINPNGYGMTSTPARYSPDVSLLASPNFPGYLVCTQINGTNGGGSSCDSPSTGISDMLTGCITRTGPCTIFGGTSVSSPVFAGIVTLLNQWVVLEGAQSTPGLGNINPALYALAVSPAPGYPAFHPVTTASTGSYSNGAWCQAGSPNSGIGTDAWPSALQCPSGGQNAGFLGFSANNSDPTTGYNLVTGLGSVDAFNLAFSWVYNKEWFPELTLTDTSSGVLPVLAGQTASGYSFTITPSGGANTFAAAVTFSCSFLSPDPTLTNSTCTFVPSSIAPGVGATNVTLTIATAGPNPSPTKPAQQHRRADNRLPWLPLSLPITGILFAGFAGKKMSKHSALAGLSISLVLLGVLIACGGGGGGSSTPPPPSVSVSVSPNTAVSLYANESGNSWPANLTEQQYTATVTNSGNTGVTWKLIQNGADCTSSGACGSLSATTGSSVTYTSPAITPNPANVSVSAVSQADASKSASAPVNILRPTATGTYTIVVTATEAATQGTLSLSSTLTVQ